MGSPQAVEWVLALLWSFHMLQGNLRSSAWSQSSPHSPLTSLCRAVSHNIFFPHSSLLCGILLFPKSVFPKALPAWLLGSAVPHGETWSRLELTRDHYVWHGAVPASVHGGPCSPLLPKLQHKHSIQHIQCY